MAKAKGLPSGAIERRYILRPTLPPIITSFAFALISLWSGAIILETVFSWPGLGRLLFQAVGLFDTPVIIGSVVIYAYLLALDGLSLGHSLRAGGSAGEGGRRSGKKSVSALREAFKEFTQYPSAIMGLVIIAALIVLSIYTVIAIPYSEGMRLWRGGEDIWIENPRNARPTLGKFFPKRAPPSDHNREHAARGGESRKTVAWRSTGGGYDARFRLSL